MKKLLIALACAASFAAMADVTPTSSGFENETAGTKIHQAANDTNWSQTDGDPASEVKTYAGESMDAYDGSVGSPLATAIGLNYLALDTGGGELLRFLAGIDNGVTNTVPVTAAAPVYIDTLVQFTATDPSTEVEIAADAKLAVWMVGDSESGYVLKVKAGQYDGNWDFSSQVFVLTNSADASFSVGPNVWYRLTVKAVQDLSPDGGASGIILPAFQVYLDGQLLNAVGGNTLSAGAVQFLDDATLPLTAEVAADFAAGKFFLSLLQQADTSTALTSVGFQGSGALDDFIMTTTLPNFLNVTDFTLTWADVTAVSYTIGNGAAVAISGSSPLAIRAPAGSVVSLLVENADGAQKVLTGTVGTDAGIDATSVTFGWPEYLGEAVAGAYEIDDKDELVLFTKGVASGLPTASTTFKLTDDIANVGELYVNGTFEGTFDGQNNEIAGVVVPIAASGAGTYQGFFQTIGAATISNLKFNGSSKSDFVRGALLVGKSTAACTFENVTVSGTLSGTHNVAGILCTSTDSVTFNYCTNKAALSTTYTKAGGIFNYTEAASKVVTFVGCSNEGTVTCAGGANAAGAWVGGMAAYIGGSTACVIQDCANSAALSATQDNCTNGNSMFRVGGLVGNANGTTTITDSSNSGALSGTGTAVGSSPGDCGVGGLVGQGSPTFAGNCSNSGTVAYTLPAGEYTFATKGSLVGTGNATVSAGAVITTTQVAEKPLGKGTCAALNFAEVDNGVATFCAADAITSNKTYNVMLDNSAAISFGLAAGDFVTLVNTPGTYSGTVAGGQVTTTSGLDIETDTETAGQVTFTLAGGSTGGASFADDGAEDLLEEGSTVTADDVATYVAGVTGAAAPAEVTKPMVLSYMLNANKILTTPETEVIKITAIEQVSGGWKITVAAALNDTDVAAGATVDMFDITGTLAVSATADLGTAFAPVAAANFTVADGDVAGTAVITVTDANAKFLKATVTK